MTADIEDIIGQVRPVERVATVCLRGDLLAAWDELERQLAAAGNAEAGSLSEVSPAVEIARRMDGLRQEIAASERTFRFRGLPAQATSDLLAEHPARQGRTEAWDPTTFWPALIAACAVDPQMTVEQATRLLAALNRDQGSTLFLAAWEASAGRVSIPFSEAASGILRGTAPK